MELTPTSMLLFLGWAVLVMLSIAANRDIFSPAKFFLLFLGVFFGDIFVAHYRFEIVLIYICLLLTAALLVAIEHRWLRHAHDRGAVSQTSAPANQRKVRHLLLWFLSMFPIGAQVILIHFAGGLVEYVNVLGMRVLEFRGLGALLTLIKLYPVISVFYFGVLLSGHKVGRSDWLLYIAHFLIFMAIALLSGSRGFLLGNVVLMAVLYHYSRKQLGILLVSFLVSVLIATAWVIGQARTGYKVEDGELRTGLHQERLEQSIGTTQYGLVPLQLVLASDREPRLQYGLTFLSALTNLVPRGVWPEKPDTGGVVLTKTYTGDAWQGGSNLSTGILTEGMLNFGVVPGLLFGFVSLLAALVLVEYWYALIVQQQTNAPGSNGIVRLLVYILVMRSIVGLLFAEFSNTAVGLLLFVASLLFVAFAYGAHSQRRSLALA